MGDQVHRKTEDSLPMRRFLNRWFEPLLDFPDLPPRLHKKALGKFSHAIGAHCKGIPSPDARWGWKNPRNMWLISFYASVYPGLKFVHVIRDGRDMSLTGNLFLLKTHGNRLLGPAWQDSPQSAQLEAWAIGNLRAADAARRCATGNYFLLRYEDLCLRPQETLYKLFQFLGVSQTLVEEAAAEIRPSAGIGRWQEHEGFSNDYISGSVKTALQRFGYLA
jgi:hypothetical protein